MVLIIYELFLIFRYSTSQKSKLNIPTYAYIAFFLGTLGFLNFFLFPNFSNLFNSQIQTIARFIQFVVDPHGFRNIIDPVGELVLWILPILFVLWGYTLLILWW